MAQTPIHLSTTPISAGPTTEEGFIADRQHFWTRFTRFATYAAIVIVVLLIVLAVTLV